MTSSGLTPFSVGPFLYIKISQCIFYDHTDIKANVIQAGFMVILNPI